MTCMTVQQILANSQAQARTLAAVQIQVDRLSQQVVLNQKAIRIITIIDNMLEVLGLHEKALSHAELARMACESQTVTEALLPLDHMQGLLRENAGRSFLTLYQSYEYVQVLKILVINDAVYCKLRIPMFTDTLETEYHVATFPRYGPHGCLQIQAPLPFVMHPTTAEVYYSDDCVGHTFKACRPGVHFPSDQQPCLHGLIDGNPEAQQQCPVLVTPMITSTIVG